MDLDAGFEEGDGPQSVFSALIKEFNTFRETQKAKLEDEELMFSPFAGMEKSSVLQEAKAAFNDSQTVRHDPQRCALLITKLVYLLVIGEKFSETDTTEVFFSVTKLFQSDNISLRRMTYLFLKEFAETTESDNIIIVISSLTKDINNSDVKLYQANAIRVLCKIIDHQMLSQIERYLKQSIVDKSSLVASSALISANQMVQDKNKREVIKRWTNEITEAINTGADMVQFQALCLLYNIKSNDRLGLSRIISNYTSKSSIRSPLANCLLIRYTVVLLRDDVASLNPQAAYNYLSQCLRNKSEIVVLEAAKAICQLPHLTNSDLMPAISVMNLFLTSGKSSLKFAAVRTLSGIASKYQDDSNTADVLLSKSQSDLEGLLSDSNLSISTLAITTLLKIANETSIDKLIKRLSTFVSDITDEFKVVIVKAVYSLCLKYPSKVPTLLNFLSTLLREEGGFDFKKSVVDSILSLIETLVQYKDVGLLHLCEFIEDCEFSSLSSKVLYYLGEYGPDSKSSSKFVRYIYNRLILENPVVRAASVSALGKFGAKCPHLRENVISLLHICLKDQDDEVRDRASFALALLKKNTEIGNEVLLNPSSGFINPLVLEKQLDLIEAKYTSGDVTELISFEVLPPVDESMLESEEKEFEKEEDASDLIGGKKDELLTEVVVKDPYGLEQLFSIEEFKSFGQLFKSVYPVELTESETEYLVSVVKHVFQRHIVFQFNVTNTLNDQVLVDVEMFMEETEGAVEWTQLLSIAAPLIRYGETKSCYVAFELPSEFHKGVFLNELRFLGLTVDAEDDEQLSYQDIKSDSSAALIEEEYPVEDIQLRVNDFVAKVPKGISNFRNTWSSTGSASDERKQMFKLNQYKSLKTCINAVVKELGLTPCEGTGEITSDTQHVLLMAGQFLSGDIVLARSQFTFDVGTKNTVLKIAIRSSNPEVSQLFMDCI